MAEQSLFQYTWTLSHWIYKMATACISDFDETKVLETFLDVYMTEQKMSLNWLSVYTV
jgi:hypothetical protein